MRRSARIVLVASPGRLFRIGHTWYSPPWRAVQARVGPWDGQSDHLPLFATLALEEE
jgi:hypothetical protein